MATSEPIESALHRRLSNALCAPSPSSPWRDHYDALDLVREGRHTMTLTHRDTSDVDGGNAGFPMRHSVHICNTACVWHGHACSVATAVWTMP